jgi:NAD(P)-dependent dehydrogenase (short-subunit alcohol dehydrogenase family)
MKEALVVGGTGDIGSAVIDELNKDYRVSATYHKNKEKAENLKLNDGGFLHHCDITNKNSIDYVVNSFPCLDLVVTAAFPFMMADAFDIKGYEDIEPYLRGYMRINSITASRMNSDGKIINVIGSSANFGSGKAPYSAACYAFIDTWAKGANASYGKNDGPQICNLLLGPVETKRWAGLSDELRSKYDSEVRDFLQPTDVAKYVRNIVDSPIVPTSIVIDSFNSLR